MRKWIYTTVSLLLILAGGGVFCALRWNAWFSNSPEQDYVVPARPNNIVLTYGEQATKERIISWRADTVLQPSFLLLHHRSHNDTLRLEADAELVRSRAGKAAFYQVRLSNLTEGTYDYLCISGAEQSDPLHFSINYSDTLNLLLFGDIQDKKGTASGQMMNQALRCNTEADAICYVGDIIERPMDKYWQIWYRSLSGAATYIPQIAVAGNHEYLKGIRGELDSRWLHVFGIPQNAPDRFIGSTTYYIDFPQCRLILMDSNPLYTLADYTVMQTWLSRVLTEAADKWKIVIMHHPIHSVGKHRYTPLMFLAFHETLKKADIVFCGHDHNYVRRQEQPVYVMTCSSEKYYEPRQSAQTNKFVECYAQDRRFYQTLRITTDSLWVKTVSVPADTVFDRFQLSH